MHKVLAGVSAFILMAYPFAVYFGLNQWGLQVVGVMLVIVFVVRILSGKRAKVKELKYLAWVTGSVGLLLLMCGLLFRQHGWLTFYPVIVNICMLAVFASSLFQPQSIIERLARLQEPHLSAHGVSYTRTVTKVWCGFFLINASIALITCFLSLQIWTLYNGLISYLLAGGLFAIEFITRFFIRKDEP